MKWEESLKEGISKAFSNHGYHEIVVHHEWQQKQGEDIVHDIARRMEKIPLAIKLIVVPDSVRDIYPVGFLDPDLQ
ncbi:MAG: hypothetical protein HY422_02060 [Candidatus Komeilibacteria bacterium]|nr:hypothetical protein [Candidatus Komeilibacteria bacterium]